MEGEGMKKRNICASYIAITMVLMVISGCRTITPPTLVGKWVGSAHNTHITPSNVPMPITLIISADGSVAGTLGRAVIRNGKIRNNRGKIEKALNMYSDFLIYADLEGSLVAEKETQYKGVFINMNVKNGKVVSAGFSTTHSPYGTPITKQGLVRGKISIKKDDPSGRSPDHDFQKPASHK